MRGIEVICKAKGFPSLCQSRPAKDIKGIKFWCFNCGHYVLPDKKHTWIFNQAIIREMEREENRVASITER